MILSTQCLLLRQRADTGHGTGGKGIFITSTAGEIRENARKEAAFEMGFPQQERRTEIQARTETELESKEEWKLGGAGGA